MKVRLFIAASYSMKTLIRKRYPGSRSKKTGYFTLVFSGKLQTILMDCGVIQTPAVMDRSSTHSSEPEIDSPSVHACLSAEFVVYWPLISMTDQCLAQRQHPSLPPSAAESKLVMRSSALGLVLAEWCILGAGAPRQGSVPLIMDTSWCDHDLSLFEFLLSCYRKQ